MRGGAALDCAAEAIDGGLQLAFAEGVLDQAGGHADAGGGKADVPVDALGEVAGDEWAEERAEVDAHVEDREACVAAAVAGFVERADERADVWLEQAGAECDEGQARVEERERLEGQDEVSERDDDAADEDGAVLAEEAVGDQAAEDRGAPGGACVGPVNRGCVSVRESEAALGGGRDHVEDEEGAHAVVAEALPHLGEKQRGQPARVPREAARLGRGVGGRPCGH